MINRVLDVVACVVAYIIYHMWSETYGRELVTYIIVVLLFGRILLRISGHSTERRTLESVGPPKRRTLEPVVKWVINLDKRLEKKVKEVTSSHE